MRWLFSGLLVGALFGAWNISAHAWGAGFAPVSSAIDDEDKDDEEEDEDEDKDEYLAIVDGDVYTGTGSILRGASLLAKNGKIEEIGYDLYIPEDAEVVDASGLRLYPGLVAVNSSGLFGSSGSFS